MARKAFLMGMRNVNEPEVPNVPPASCRQDRPESLAIIVSPMRRGSTDTAEPRSPPRSLELTLSSVAEVGRTNGLFATTNKNRAGGGRRGLAWQIFLGSGGTLPSHHLKSSSGLLVPQKGTTRRPLLELFSQALEIRSHFG